MFRFTKDPSANYSELTLKSEKELHMEGTVQHTEDHLLAHIWESKLFLHEDSIWKWSKPKSLPVISIV